jgi:DnaJ-class molecular chaperone
MTIRSRVLGVAALLGAAGFSWCGAQAPLPPPVIMAPKPIIKQTEVVVTNAAKPAIVWCPTCRGRKTVGVEVEGNCRTCNGTGKVVSGFAKTEAPCSYCKGAGKVLNIVQNPCPSCGGKGQLRNEYFEQFIACTNCNGTKVFETNVTVKCATCDGAGKIVKKAGASGGFGSGGSGGKKMGSKLMANVAAQEQPCPFCGSTGTVDKQIRKDCPTCYGAGLLPPPPPPPPPPKDG